MMQIPLPSFPKLALVLSGSGLLVGLTISFLIPPQYVSTAVLRCESQGTSWDSRNEARQMYANVMTRSFLSSVIQDPGLALFSRERSLMPLSDIIDMIRANTHYSVLPASSGTATVFTISFTYGDPAISRKVTQTFVKRIVSQAFGQRIREAKEAQSDDSQIAELQWRIASLEKRLGIQPEGTTAVLPGTPTKLNLAVLQPASTPSWPASPNRVAITSMGVCGGFVLAVLLLWVRLAFAPVTG